MEKKKYSEKLKDPRWQKKRLEILERDGWKCMSCSDKDSTLHVHHIFYLPNQEPWEIPNGLLITLCESCHRPTCEYGPCDECKDFSLDKDNSQRCEGFNDVPYQLIESIASLLNEIWKNDNIGDFSSLIGYIAMNIGKHK